MTPAKIGFELRKIEVPLSDILPLHQIKNPGTVCRYKTILVSVKAVGLIEPLMVHPQTDAPGKYFLLDGHLRLMALRELGQTVAPCIIATDEECYTYNIRVNRVSSIQEHRMICKAIEMGVPSDRIAAALNTPVRVVKAYVNLLVGIHAEVADLLKDKNVAPAALRKLRAVNAVRQVEIAELMVGTNNYSRAYVEALVLATPADQLVQAVKPRIPKRVSAESIAKMEQETQTLQHGLKAIESNYGKNVLCLTVARSYIRKMVEAPEIKQFLTAHYGDVLSEFMALVESETL